MQRFVVVKQGVYIQNVYGPYTQIEAAKIRAQYLAMNDDDGYHDYTVRVLNAQGLTEDTGASYKKFDARFGAYLLNEAKREDRARRTPF